MTDREKEALRADIAVEDDREASVDEKMMERLLAQPFLPFEQVRAETERELDRREGEWSAFTSSVFRQIDDGALEAKRMSVEERAISAMKAEVDGELAEVAPRFEGQFQKELEERIWREAKARPSVGAAVSGWLDRAKQWFVLQPRTAGFATAAAAAAIALVIAVPQLGNDATVSAPLSAEVQIDRVTFEGNVTVMEQGGIPVVWLADGST